MKSRAKSRAKKLKQRSHARKTTAQAPLAGPRLSLCMIVKDEARHLASCLKSVKPVVDELIVVDTGSTDATPEIARGFGAKVFHFPWTRDFSAARNESIRHAGGDYILWLDADDVLGQEGQQQLLALRTHLPREKNQAYFFQVNNEDPKLGTTSFHQLRLFPNLPEARFEYAVHEQITHRLEAAGVTLLRAPVTVHHLGNVDHEDLRRKSQRNLDIIEEELKKRPRDLVMHYQAARTLANLKAMEKAVAHMQQVLDGLKAVSNQGALYFEAGLLLGRYYNEMGLFSSAESTLTEFLAIYENAPLLLMELAKSYYLQERYEEVIHIVEPLRGQDLQAGQVAVNESLIRYQEAYFLGKAYEATGDLPRALEMYQQSLGYHQGDFKSYHALGMISLKCGNYEEALNYLREAGRKAPEDDCVLQSNLGLVYKKLGRLQEAEKALMRAMEINPDRMEAFINLGYVYLETKAYAKAASSFKRALKLDPNLWDVYLSLCEAYFNLGQVDKLVETCNDLLAGLGLQVNQTLDSLEDLAAIFEALGDHFSGEGQEALAVMAHQTGFGIYPLTGILHKLLPLAAASGRRPRVMATIRTTLDRYGKNPQVMAAVQSVLDQFQQGVQQAYS